MLATSSTIRQLHQNWPKSSSRLQEGINGMGALTLIMKRILSPASVIVPVTISSQPGTRGPPLGVSENRVRGGIASDAGLSLCSGCQPKADQRHACEAKSEGLQRPAARDRLGQALGELIG